MSYGEVEGEFKRAEEQTKFIDAKEYQGRFMLSPDVQLEDNSDFSFLDKNTSMTNLKWRNNEPIDEVGQARAYLRANNVLNNTRHYHYEDKEILLGHEVRTLEDGSEKLVPIREIRKVRTSLYPLTKHNVDSRHITFVTTASAREGHLINKAISNRLERVGDETVRDKTEVKTGFFQRNQKRD